MKREEYKINISKPSGLEKKIIYELQPLERDNIKNSEELGKFLGAGIGRDMGHCIYMGTRYCKNFLDRVTHYFPHFNESRFEIEFYEVDK